MQYDGAGRKTYESHPGRADTYVYDPAGNVTQHQAPLGTINFTYDAANQLSRRVVPELRYSSTHCSAFIGTWCDFSFPTTGASELCIAADTAYFSYDGSGRIIRADNGRSRVRRSYKPNGLLAHDTLTLRTYYSPGVSPCELAPSNGPIASQEWTSHVYTLQSSYDLDGRRTQLTSPASTITYSYDTDGRGLLTGVSEAGYTSTTLNYDAAGRIRSLNYPGSVTDTRTYGTSGFLTDRVVGSILDDDLSYDYRGLITSAYNTYRRGQTAQVTATTAYNGLGAVVSATDHTTTSGAAENFRVDAIGNRLRIARPGLKPSTHPDFWGVRFQSYDANARLSGVVDTTVAGTDDFVLSETYQYDGSGALSLQYSSEWKSGDGTLYDQTKSYPGIDDRLAVVNRRVGVSSASHASASEKSTCAGSRPIGSVTSPLGPRAKLRTAYYVK